MAVPAVSGKRASAHGFQPDTIDARPMRIQVRDIHRRRLGTAVLDQAERPTRVPLIQTSRQPAPGSHQPATAPVAHHQHRTTDHNSRTTDNGQRTTDIFLTWDAALDDAGHLRCCVVCGCPDLYHEKAFPQVTAIVVVLAFVGAVIGILQLATNTPILVAMSVVLTADIGILLFSRRRLVCYRCRSSFHNLPIARYHDRWDGSIADRYSPAAPSITALPAAPPRSIPDIPSTAAAARPIPSERLA